MTQSDLRFWQYNEFQQVGTDYSSPDEAAVYDASHADFRDTDAECSRILDIIQIQPEHVIIDFGAGTGTFAVAAAGRCKQVHAVDVSEAMIAQARAKADQSGVTNIEFHHAGFLTHTHTGPPVDAITTTFAFHHLPDFWKGLALKRLHGMIAPGGFLYIHDVVMEEANAVENISALVDKLAAAGGSLLREDTLKHFREEFSTYDWVMDGLLARSGFRVDTKQLEDGVLGTYRCTRI